MLDGQDLTPITRKEQFIKRIYDKTQEIPDPITREEWFLKKAGEGTSPVTIEQLNVTENGTYSEPGKAYSPVIVNVPEPTLITKTITENGTYNASADNADGYSQVTVAVDGFKKKSIANTPTDIASFNDGTANPMPSLEISIVPVQSGSGDPSPQNVRPISGWSGANVGVHGANFFDKTKITQGKALNENGEAINNENFGISDYTRVSEGTYYIENVTRGENQWTLRIHGYNASKEWIQQIYQYTVNAGVKSAPFVIPNGIKFVRISIGIVDRQNVDILQLSNVQSIIYSPYQGSTTSIPFHDNSDNPITVYGGTLNVTSGELRVMMTNVDLGTLSWEIGYGGFVATITNPAPANNDVPANMLCTKYPIKAYNAHSDKSISRIANTNIIRFRDSDYESAAAAKTALNGVQLVYELATPQTYQLTPTQVSTLLGLNNIFADCGQVLEGEYFVTL